MNWKCEIAWDDEIFDGFFEQFAWECCFQGPICLGTLILATFLLGDLLGVGLLGAVIQGCSKLGLPDGKLILLEMLLSRRLCFTEF